MWILLVEDDATTANSIELMLRSEGFTCDVTEFGEEGFELGENYAYDLIVLDLMLPDVDGLDVLQRLRDKQVDTPVLILSGLSDSEHKVKGLGLGADDYLTKPFDKAELVAHIRAIARRASGDPEALIRKGRLTMLSERTGVHD
ncbi:MAG: response regulator [Alphaproteobacteria bacterium]